MECESKSSSMPQTSQQTVKNCPTTGGKKKFPLGGGSGKKRFWSKYFAACGPKRDCWYAVGFVLLPHIGGLRSALIIKENQSWYEGLDKPAWGPSQSLFAPVWTILYTSMGYASFLVWRDGGGFCYGRAKVPLLVYGTQLALNWAWPYIFFKTHNLGGALATVSALWLAVAATSLMFCPINQCAGWLMVPYLIWVTYAAAINFRVWQGQENQE